MECQTFFAHCECARSFTENNKCAAQHRYVNRGNVLVLSNLPKALTLTSGIYDLNIETISALAIWN